MILNSIIILVLLAIAIVLLILELFFLPGLSVAGFMSVLFYGVALYFAFAHMGVIGGVITLLVALVLTVSLVCYFMRSRTLDKISLHTDIDSSAPTRVNESIKAGAVGTTITRLNPMGRVMVDGITAEARAFHFIEEGTVVRVMKVESTAVVVEPVE